MADILTKDQLTSLQKVGLKKDQIGIIVHNLEKSIAGRVIKRDMVSIIVHNLVNNERYRKQFFTNPQKMIEEANPQPSP